MQSKAKSVDELFKFWALHVEGSRGVFFNREKQLFAMNPEQDLNYHTETRLSDIL